MRLSKSMRPREETTVRSRPDPEIFDDGLRGIRRFGWRRRGTAYLRGRLCFENWLWFAKRTLEPSNPPLQPSNPLNSVSLNVRDASLFLPIGTNRQGTVFSHFRSRSLGRADRFADPGDACACRGTFPVSDPRGELGQGAEGSESEILQRLTRYRATSAASDPAPRPVGSRQPHHDRRLKFEDALRRTALEEPTRKDGIL